MLPGAHTRPYRGLLRCVCRYVAQALWHRQGEAVACGWRGSLVGYSPAGPVCMYSCAGLATSTVTMGWVMLTHVVQQFCQRHGYSGCALFHCTCAPCDDVACMCVLGLLRRRWSQQSCAAQRAWQQFASGAATQLNCQLLLLLLQRPAPAPGCWKLLAQHHLCLQLVPLLNRAPCSRSSRFGLQR